MKTVSAAALFSSIQKKAYLATSELTGMGIARVKSFSYDTDHPNENMAGRASFWLSPEYFPFSKSRSVNLTSGIASYDPVCSVHASLSHSELSTELFNNERDYILLAPMKVQLAALKKFRDDLGNLKLYEKTHRPPAQGAVDNLRRNLKKLKKSVAGKAQEVEVYDYVPETKGLGKDYIKQYSLGHLAWEYSDERLKSVDYSPKEMLEKVSGEIGRAKSSLADMGVSRVLSGDISNAKGWWKDGPPVTVNVRPVDFPFERATRLALPDYSSVAYHNQRDIGVVIENEDLRVVTDVPFARADLLVDLPSRLKNGVLEEREIRRNQLVFSYKPSSCSNVVVEVDSNPKSTVKISVLKD